MCGRGGFIVILCAEGTTRKRSDSLKSAGMFLDTKTRQTQKACRDVELVMGLEPATYALRMRCSTN